MARQFQIHKLVTAAVLLASLVQVLDDEPAGAWGNRPRWGDQGDGTYRNPVLPADYSDLDAIQTRSNLPAMKPACPSCDGKIS